MSSRHWRLLILSGLGGLGVLVAMIAVFLTLTSIGHDEWTAVDAKVLRTEIKSYRSGGPPEWALFVNLSYTAAGKRYDDSVLRVYSHEEWDATKAEQRKWPPGRIFAIYHHPDRHSETSLARDGGREATAVVVALFTPLAIFFCTLIVIVVRRRSRRRV